MSDTVIHVENLGRSFESVVALDSISFEVQAGTVLGLLGPNGAGKTTTVRILTTILKPDHGHATVLDLDVVRQAEQVRGRIGLAGQYAAVDENLTGRETCASSGSSATNRSRSVDPTPTAPRRFDWRTAANRPVRTYSGGMRRRLDLAAAPGAPAAGPVPRRADHRPRSEWSQRPVGHHRAAGRRRHHCAVDDPVSAKKPIALADRIIVIDDGNIIAEGTATELKSGLGNPIVEVRMGEVPARRARGGEPTSVASDRPMSWRTATPWPSGSATAAGACSRSRPGPRRRRNRPRVAHRPPTHPRRRLPPPDRAPRRRRVRRGIRRSGTRGEERPDVHRHPVHRLPCGQPLQGGVGRGRRPGRIPSGTSSP